jgi:hypothetical protein
VPSWKEDVPGYDANHNCDVHFCWVIWEKDTETECFKEILKLAKES